MTKEAMIKVLRYKAEHIKAKIRPEFFAEVADMLEQQPCEDAISRTQALSDYADWYGYGYRENTFYKLLKNMPPVTPKQIECEDAISRADAVRVASGYCHPSNIAKELAKLPPVTPKTKTGYCKDCKWWKDSDGAFRRGIGAESQCPMNRIEVFEGNGYCYMFEPQESEE